MAVLRIRGICPSLISAMNAAPDTAAQRWLKPRWSMAISDTSTLSKVFDIGSGGREEFEEGIDEAQQQIRRLLANYWPQTMRQRCWYVPLAHSGLTDVVAHCSAIVRSCESLLSSDVREISHFHHIVTLSYSCLRSLATFTKSRCGLTSKIGGVTNEEGQTVSVSLLGCSEGWEEAQDEYKYI